MRVFPYICLLVFLLTSCGDELDSITTSGDQTNTSALSIEVSNRPVSKGLIEGLYMPEGSAVGVFLRKADGTRYDGLSLQGIKYTAEGMGSEQRWLLGDKQTSILSASVGTAYTFYPWVETEGSELKIPITNDGTDWMYSSAPATNLSAGNPIAQFEMVHAMTIIRCKIVRGNYSGAGVVTTVGVESDGLAKGGNIDLSSASVTDHIGAGEAIEVKKPGTVGNDPLVVDLWGVPNGLSSELSFRIVVDKHVYRATAPQMILEAGVVNNFTITLNIQAMSVSTVSVTDWRAEDLGNSNTASADPWDIARRTDGVYAIDKFGDPVPYEAAVGTDYEGVAFVLKGKAYQVAKVNATGYEGAETVKWRPSFYDFVGLRNYGTVDGVEGSGYFGTGTPQLSTDPNTWKSGALSDFGGAANTEVLLSMQVTDGVPQDYSISQAIVNFRNNSENNEGYSDWFAPACGELAFMCVKHEELNDLLHRVGGAAMSGTYFSVSEFDHATVWCVHFNQHNSRVILYQTHWSWYVRLLRYI